MATSSHRSGQWFVPIPPKIIGHSVRTFCMASSRPLPRTGRTAPDSMRGRECSTHAVVKALPHISMLFRKAFGRALSERHGDAFHGVLDYHSIGIVA
jgi:hypothetical protein